MPAQDGRPQRASALPRVALTGCTGLAANMSAVEGWPAVPGSDACRDSTGTIGAVRSTLVTAGHDLMVKEYER